MQIEEEFKNVYEYDCNAIEEAYVIMLTTLDKIFNSNVERQCDETEVSNLSIHAAINKKLVVCVLVYYLCFVEEQCVQILRHLIYIE